jgi:hypothetical protein
MRRRHLGIVFAPKASMQKEIEQGVLVPCFTHQEEWWLDLIVIFRKREYQPLRVQYVPSATRWLTTARAVSDPLVLNTSIQSLSTIPRSLASASLIHTIGPLHNRLSQTIPSVFATL